MDNQQINTSENQLTTKELISKIFNFFKFLSIHWRLLLIGLSLGAISVLVRDYFTEKEKQFEAFTTFNLELEGSSNNSMSSLAAFGIGGGNVGGDFFSSQNFPLIIESKVIYENAFMKEIKVGKDSTKMLFINYFIDSSNIKEKEWAGSLFRKPFTEGIDYKFTKKDPKNFTPLESLISNAVYTKLTEATSVIPVEESSFISIQSLLTNEDLVLNWVDVLLQSTEEFYKDVKTKKTRRLLATQEKRLDSLKYLMRSTDKKVARLTFDNPYVVNPSGPMQQQQVNRDNSYYSNQFYTQMAKIEELKKVIIEQTPIFTKLEESRKPLVTALERSSLDIKVSSILGLVLAMAYIIILKLYKEVMN